MAPPDPADPLSDLRDRLHATQEAAARLAGDEGRVPPQGWAGAPRTDGGADDDLAQLVALLGSLRELVPPELQQQVTDLIRQVLLLVRAILDPGIDRLPPGGGGRSPPRGPAAAGRGAAASRTWRTSRSRERRSRGAPATESARASPPR